MPEISIVIPIYKAEKYLSQCISSLLSQTFKDFELILVNDGTPDNSMEIVNQFNDPRITVINQENKGAGEARNVGMRIAKGKYLSILDADDFFEPQMLETLYDKAEQEKADIVICGFRIYNNKKNKFMYSKPPTIIKTGKPEDFGNNLMSMQSPNAWTKLYRTDFVKKNNLEFDNVPYCNDMAFTYSSLFCASRITTIPDILINYRFFTETQASFNKPDNFDFLVRTILRIRDKLKELNLYKKYETMYLEGIRQHFQFEMHTGMAPHKKEVLLSLKTIIPKDIFDKLFSTKIAVSVIVPVYNVEPFLKECLDSIINQSLPNIEIICVNDGSTDNSQLILDEYSKKDKRIRVITQKNEGLPVAREAACKVAKGDYLLFLDSDDYLDKEACETLYTYARLYQLDMLQFQATEFDSKSRKEFYSNYHSISWAPKGIRAVFNKNTNPEYMNIMTSTACLTFYSRNFLNENNIHWLPKKICYEDNPFFTEAVLQADRIGILKERLYFRRIHPQSITQNKEKNFFDYLEASKISLETVKKLAPHLLKGFTRKHLQAAFNQYRGFDYDTKQEYTPRFVECIRYIVHNYCSIIPKDVYRWYELHR